MGSCGLEYAMWAELLHWQTTKICRFSIGICTTEATRVSLQRMDKMSMKDLHELVMNGTLSDYKIVSVNADGVEGVLGAFRNSDRLTLTFPNGEVLVIDTFCSGSAENTSISCTRVVPKIDINKEGF